LEKLSLAFSSSSKKKLIYLSRLLIVIRFKIKTLNRKLKNIKLHTLENQLQFKIYIKRKMKADFLLATVLILGLAGLNMACEPPDCGRNDCGTCSNACCTLDFFFSNNSLDLNRELTNLLLM
jgi:hypothetical protein